MYKSDATKYIAKKVRQEITSAEKNDPVQIIDNIDGANPKSWYIHIKNITGGKRSGN